MTAVVVTGSNLARLVLVIALVALAVFAFGCTVVLAICGYIVFTAGLTKGAMVFWGMACVPLAAVALLASYIPSSLRSPQ